jgi:hypothetical protein
MSQPAALYRQTGGIGLAVCLVIWPAGVIQAGTVYRCLQKSGAVAFTQYAVDPSCQPVNVQPYEPDPDDAARQQEALKKWRDDRSQAWREGRQKKAAKKPATGNRDTADADYRVSPGSGAANSSLPGEPDFKKPPGAGR